MMNIALLFSVGFFLCALFARSVLHVKVCALCAAVSATWVTLLALRLFGFPVNTLVLSVYMGGTVVGLMYVLERRLPEAYGIFKLPFVLSMFWGVYAVLSGYVSVLSLGILGATWAAALLLAVARSKKYPSAVRAVTALIACCRDW